MKVSPTIAALAAALALAGCEAEVADDGGPVPGVAIDLLEALAIAREREPDGVAIEAELDIEEEDDPFFEVEMYVEAAAEVREVVIEGDGTVSDVVVDPEDLAKALVVVDALAQSTVTLDEAIAIAEAELDGDAFAVAVDGTTAIEVVIVTADDTVVLAVDQRDGTTMAVGGEPDDADD